jgi:transcriptional regulator with XRE-family HTH domain
MENFSKVAAQVRGARALLGWSQSYLAEGISVRRVIIADLESCKREPQGATLSALITELSAAGIVFTETGVEFVEWPPRPYVPTGCTTLKKRARRQWCSRTLQKLNEPPNCGAVEAQTPCMSIT